MVWSTWEWLGPVLGGGLVVFAITLAVAVRHVKRGWDVEDPVAGLSDMLVVAAEEGSAGEKEALLPDASIRRQVSGSRLRGDSDASDRGGGRREPTSEQKAVLEEQERRRARKKRPALTIKVEHEEGQRGQTPTPEGAESVLPQDKKTPDLLSERGQAAGTPSVTPPDVQRESLSRSSSSSSIGSTSSAGGSVSSRTIHGLKDEGAIRAFLTKMADGLAVHMIVGGEEPQFVPATLSIRQGQVMWASTGPSSKSQRWFASPQKIKGAARFDEVHALRHVLSSTIQSAAAKALVPLEDMHPLTLLTDKKAYDFTFASGIERDNVLAGFIAILNIKAKTPRHGRSPRSAGGR